MGYSCGSNLVRRGSKRDTGELYDKFSCTFLSSGLPLIGRSFKGQLETSFAWPARKRLRVSATVVYDQLGAQSCSVLSSFFL